MLAKATQGEERAQAKQKRSFLVELPGYVKAESDRNGKGRGINSTHILNRKGKGRGRV